jgi:hypothetical protein
MSDVPDETENESILAFRSKNEEETERVQKAAEDIAARMFKDALDLLSPFRTFDAKKKKTSEETPLERDKKAHRRRRRRRRENDDDAIPRDEHQQLRLLLLRVLDER